MPLSDAAIKALRPRRRRYSVTDSRGLVIEVLPNGKLSWRFRYRVNNRPEKVTIGRYPDISLKMARAERDRLAGIVAAGNSPAHEKQLAKRALASDSTLRDFAARYYKDVVLRDRKDPSNMLRYLNKEILPAFGHKAIREVTGADVQSLVFRKRDHGHQAAAADLRNLLKRMFDYAVVCGAIQFNPARALPLRFITRARSRTRSLSADEIKIYLELLYQSNIRRQFKFGLHLILLTLVRKSELRLAKWADVNLDIAEWQIPPENSKTSKPHIVYLSRQAVELFRGLKNLAADSQLVMPGRSSLNKPFAANAMNKSLEGLSFGIPPFTIHDLRRTGSTLLHEQGFRPDVVEKALNHQIGGVRGIYNRAEYATERRAMLQAWADYICELVRLG